MTTITRYLKPVHCGQKSFYDKAIVLEDYDVDRHETIYYRLKSYDTIVVDVEVFSKSGCLLVTCTNMHSATTKRHIKEFVIQYLGLVAWAKIEKEYNTGKTQWVF